jgi:type II secretory pathway component PulF
MDDSNHDGGTLTATAAEEVLQRAATIASTAMPMAAGLRVAAGESDSRRVRNALLSVAADLERGRSLEECLLRRRKLPQSFRGALAAAERSGAFSPLLVQWLADRRAARQRWRSILASLSYPALAMALSCLVFLLFAVWVVPVFGKMYDEFGMKLPRVTHMTLWAAESGSRILMSMIGVGAVSVVVLRLVGGAAGWSLLVTNMPLIGLPWHWTGVAEMLRMLSLLVEHRVPLPEALRLAADGTSDAYLGEQCRVLASRVEQGSSLAMALVRLRTLPLSIVPLVRWGEHHGVLADALRSAAEMIEGRLNMRTDMLVQVIPPVLLICVGATLLSMIVGLFLPMIGLIQGLV